MAQQGSTISYADNFEGDERKVNKGRSIVPRN